MVAQKPRGGFKEKVSRCDERVKDMRIGQDRVGLAERALAGAGGQPGRRGSRQNKSRGDSRGEASSNKRCLQNKDADDCQRGAGHQVGFLVFNSGPGSPAEAHRQQRGPPTAWWESLLPAGGSRANQGMCFQAGSWGKVAYPPLKRTLWVKGTRKLQPDTGTDTPTQAHACTPISDVSCSSRAETNKMSSHSQVATCLCGRHGSSSLKFCLSVAPPPPRAP